MNIMFQNVTYYHSLYFIIYRQSISNYSDNKEDIRTVVIDFVSVWFVMGQ